jgi:predicted Zn finger-like uncharacterized protein
LFEIINYVYDVYMILQCSKCNARYLVPDSAIGASGRTVRCARCSHSWFEEPIVQNVSENIPDLDEMLGSINETPIPIKPLAAGANVPARLAPRPAGGLKAMVFASFLLVAGLGLFIAKPSLFVPSSVGLALEDVKFNKKTDEQSNIVEISGNIINSGDDEKIIPTMRVTLLDEAGNKLQFWEYAGGGKTLKPKENIPFTTGELPIKFITAKRFVLELGTPLELALRGKPD